MQPLDPRSVVSAGYMPLDVISFGGEVWRRAGGTAGNVAAILAFLGWDSVLAGRIGSDHAGDALIRDLGRSGLDCSLIHRDPAGSTNRLIHEIGDSDHRYLFTCPNCGQRLPRSRPLTLDQASKVLENHSAPTVFFFDRANPATVALAEAYAENGRTLVVFEPSTLANASLFHRALAAAAVVKLSKEHRDPDIWEDLAPDTVPIQVITGGADGARYRVGRSSWRRVATFQVPLVDASGAGDWTTASMLHRLAGLPDLSGPAIAEAIEFGHALAALNCSLPGARGLMEGRSRARVLALGTRLRNGRPQFPMPVDRPEATAKPHECSWCLLTRSPESLPISAREGQS
jgi:fructokinase